MKKYYVYILRCADDSYYTGVTNNVQKRFYEHGQGLAPGCYTNSRRPLELVYTAEFRNVADAIASEKQIKGWTRKKKEALMRNDFDALVTLSQNSKKKSPSTGSG